MSTVSPATEQIVVDGVEVRLETGRIARQANGAIVLRSGDTMVLATAVSSLEPRPWLNFFPLTVEYRERYAAGGVIPHSRNRREGRIGDDEILTSRLIDRTLRPLFPKGYRCDTQIQITVFSADASSDLESLALIAACAAVHISDIPFGGPVCGLRVVRHESSHHLLSSPDVRREADIDLMVSSTREGLVMVEGGARLVSEAEILGALDAATEATRPLLDTIDRLRAEAGTEKRVHHVPSLPQDLVRTVAELADEEIRQALAIEGKDERSAAIVRAQRGVSAALSADSAVFPEKVSSAFEKHRDRIFRDYVLTGNRIGGRAHDEVRPIHIEVGPLPSNHGSALFTRGETQALVSVTLGGDRDALQLESMRERQIVDPFILHYNFPSYSVGEVRPIRAPGRREIGHGNLARAALLPVLPDQSEEFPYVVRVVSDITESNGSSSMATVCGASLALMDAGVPIEGPVAGIAMGLIKEGGRIAILTDILGDEDHLGDMDFKVAGTADGITAVQLDNKLGSLPRTILEKALSQANRGRRQILDMMAQAIGEPRSQVAAHAPQVASLRINPERIGAVIGSGGQTIQGIQAETNSQISIADDGLVRIYAADRSGLTEAVKRIENIALELRQNGLYQAEVVAVKDFGAFVRIGDHEGLVHISELAEGRVESTEAVVSPGDKVLIRVIGVDDRGRLRLSRRAALGSSFADALNR